MPSPFHSLVVHVAFLSDSHCTTALANTMVIRIHLVGQHEVCVLEGSSVVGLQASPA